MTDKDRKRMEYLQELYEIEFLDVKRQAELEWLENLRHIEMMKKMKSEDS